MNAQEQQKVQTRDSFNRAAPHYDEVGPGAFAHYGRRLVELVGIAPGQRVLDVATGRGAVLFPATAAVGATGAVIGIDLAEEMLRATADEATRRGLAADLRVMDAEQLDFPDASFDRVLCGFGIMFFPDLARALGEFRRVLKPGGLLGLSTWRATHYEDMSAVLDQLGFAPRILARTRFGDADDLAHILARAGFAGGRVVLDPATFHHADLEAYWQCARSTAGMRRRLDGLDEAQAARTRAALADRLRPYQREDGLHVEATALIAVASR